MGSALEYYDFYIYGLASALIFGPLFFKPLGEDGALIASFATYGVGFAARPFGGMVFGYIGDRFGRKMVLILTIGLMGTASFAIGLLPTYEQAGMLGAVLLVTLRILPGAGCRCGTGGRHHADFRSRAAPPSWFLRRRSRSSASSWAPCSAPERSPSLPWPTRPSCEGWLWRVPFLASVILIVVAIFIRLRLKETPVFQELEKHKNVVKNPIGQLWKHSKKNVLIGIGLRMGENGNSSIYSALLIAFLAQRTASFPGDKFIGPVGLLIAAGFAAVMVVTFGALSDRFGRVPVYRYGALFQALIALPAFYLVTLGNVTLVWIVMVVGIALGVQSMLGPQCPLLPELFGSQYRFTGVAMSRELSAVLAGGLGPAGGRRAAGRHGPLLAGACASTRWCLRSSRSSPPSSLPRRWDATSSSRRMRARRCRLLQPAPAGLQAVAPSTQEGATAFCAGNCLRRAQYRRVRNTRVDGQNARRCAESASRAQGGAASGGWASAIRARCSPGRAKGGPTVSGGAALLLCGTGWGPQ